MNKSKIIFTAIFFATFALSGFVKADDPAANTTCAKVYHIKGNVYSQNNIALTNTAGKIQACRGMYIITGKNSECSMMLDNGIDIRIDEASKIQMGKITGNEIVLNLVKGRIWVETSKQMESNGNIKVKTKQGDVIFNDGIFSISATLLESYKGSAQILNDKNKIDISQGYAFGKGNKQNINQKQLLPAWDSSNINSDKLNVLVDLNVPDKYRDMAQNVFKDIYSENYSVDKVIFGKEDAANTDEYDVIVNANMQMLPKKNQDDEDKINLNGTVVESASVQNIGVIDVSENIVEAVADKFLVKSAQAVLMKAAESSIQNIDFFRENITSQGRAVIIEMTDMDKEGIDLIRTYLNSLPGLNNLTEKDFYNQKTIFQLNYAGTGDDIADFLNGKKVKNKAINVWKYSKNNVKLSIK